MAKKSKCYYGMVFNYITSVVLITSTISCLVIGWGYKADGFFLCTALSCLVTLLQTSSACFAKIRSLATRRDVTISKTPVAPSEIRPLGSDYALRQWFITIVTRVYFQIYRARSPRCRCKLYHHDGPDYTLHWLIITNAILSHVTGYTPWCPHSLRSIIMYYMNTGVKNSEENLQKKTKHGKNPTTKEILVQNLFNCSKHITWNKISLIFIWIFK